MRYGAVFLSGERLQQGVLLRSLPSAVTERCNGGSSLLPSSKWLDCYSADVQVVTQVEIKDAQHGWQWCNIALI